MGQLVSNSQKLSSGLSKPCDRKVDFFIVLNGFHLPGADFTQELNVRIVDERITLMIGWRFQTFDNFENEVV